MKILLINPPSENELLGNNPSIIGEERGYNPPLGILYIAGYLEKYTDYDVEVLDTQAEEIGYDRLKRHHSVKITRCSWYYRHDLYPDRCDKGNKPGKICASNCKDSSGRPTCTYLS